MVELFAHLVDRKTSTCVNVFTFVEFEYIRTTFSK